MLKALLVDDEVNNLETLEFLIRHDCEGLEVAAKLQSAAAARDWLQSNTADVIFLDIAMPAENGFQFLNSLPVHNFKVVFCQ